jgi:HD-like signal output (HDOD) protein
LSTSVLENLGGTSFQALSMDTFWAHSLCVGVAARTLAALKGVPVRKREEYFVAGLLHDLGKIPLNSLFQEEYRRVVDLNKNTPQPLRQAENEILGVDHTVVGGMIAERWDLGAILKDALAFHHASIEGAGRNRQLTMIVALANLLAPQFDYGSEGNRFPANSEVITMLKKVGVREAELVKMKRIVFDEIEKAKVFLQLTIEY